MKAKPGILNADYKVKNGKLLRVRMTLNTGGSEATIESIAITGDFFMHPEEAIESLETLLLGTRWNAAALQEKVALFFSGEVEVIGARAEDFVHVILKAA